MPSKVPKNVPLATMVIVPGVPLKQQQQVKIRTVEGSTGKAWVQEPAEVGKPVAVNVQMIAEPYKPQLTIPRGVFYGKRQANDKIVAIIFVACVALATILCIVGMTTGDAPIALSDEWYDGYFECRDKASGNGTRHLSESRHLIDDCNGSGSKPCPESVWDIFELAPGIPVAMILLVLLVGVGWILLLQKQAWPCIVATEFIKAFCCFFAAYELANADIIPVIFTLLGCISLLFFYVNRASFKVAAGILSEATVALQKNPEIFTYTLLAYIPYLVFLSLFIGFQMNLGKHQTWMIETTTDEYGFTSTDCALRLDPGIERASRFICLVLVWLTCTSSQIRLNIVSGAVAHWWFHEAGEEFDPPLEEGEKRPTSPSLYFCQTSFSSSLGTLSTGGAILTILELIKEKIERKICGIPCFCLDPTALVLRVLYCFVASCVQAYTKFTTVVHTLRGKPFFESASLTLALLKRNFVGAYVASLASTSTLVVGSLVFSYTLAIATWVWVEGHFNFGIIDHVMDSGENNTVKILFYISLFLMAFFIYNPILSIMLFVIVGLGGMDLGVFMPLFAGCFVGSIVFLIFTYLARIVIDAVTASFICCSVDRDAGIMGAHPALEATLAKFKGMYTVAYEPGSAQLSPFMPATISQSVSEDDMKKHAVMDSSVMDSQSKVMV